MASHRYHDFPFVFTPAFWHRFRDRFARDATPVERPHQDRILTANAAPPALSTLGTAEAEAIWHEAGPTAELFGYSAD